MEECGREWEREEERGVHRRGVFTQKGRGERIACGGGEKRKRKRREGKCVGKEKQKRRKIK